LAGTEVYGSPTDDNIAWSIDFESAVANYDQFLFTTGDCVHWLVANKNDVVGGTPYTNEPRDISYSSSSSTSYQARWYNRDGYLEDPWISVDDHASAVAAGTIVYGENSFGGTHASAVLPLHGGADVYIRDTVIMASSQLTANTWAVTYQDDAVPDFTTSSTNEVVLSYLIGAGKTPTLNLYASADCSASTAATTGVATPVVVSQVVSGDSTLDTLTVGIDIDKALITSSNIWNNVDSSLEFCLAVTLENGGEVITEE